MTRHFLILILCLSATFCFGQKNSKKFEDLKNKCQGSWQYFTLEETTIGQVLFHEKAYFLCGVIATASLTIIKTSLGDTIRVLELCNTNKEFKKTNFVKVTPNHNPDFGVSIPKDKTFGCLVKKTCYGTVSYPDK